MARRPACLLASHLRLAPQVSTLAPHVRFVSKNRTEASPLRLAPGILAPHVRIISRKRWILRTMKQKHTPRKIRHCQSSASSASAGEVRCLSATTPDSSVLTETVHCSKPANSSACIEWSSSDEDEDWMPLPDLLPSEVRPDGDFVLPCGLRQAQVMDLMHRNLTPEDYELLKVLDDSVPKVDTMSAEQIRSLSRVEAGCEDCGVCLASFAQKEQVIRLPCGHLYHQACIEKWLTQCKNKCPICSAEVEPMS
eukprot:TRINITY_DN34182_c0_g1_i1.p1 TRINITY_DN34182_c0_g1~~TRINITY_DN34182_c0_g1_i1.p1  ORF type:complete len:264 (-),score=26.70 TRINITY_DN34182_c0_g1_i1:121-876(-)